MQAIWWWLFVTAALISTIEVGIYVGRAHGVTDSNHTRDTIKQATGIVATLTALVLGLLIASGQKYFEQQSKAVTSIVVDVAHLDEVLQQFGQSSSMTRAKLRQSLDPILYSLWSGAGEATLSESSRARNEAFLSAILALPEDTPQHTLLKQAAYDIAGKLIQERFELAVLESTVLPDFLLAALVAWSCIVFLGLGACASANPITRAALYLGAASTATAVYLVIEFDTAFSGSIQISNTAVDLLGQALGSE